MTELEMVSHETMAFMRGRYRLDELGNGRDELKFRQGRRTILTVYIHPDRYAFMLIFGRRERELFEAQRAEFPQYILDCYDGARTYPDGKWMLIDVTTLAQLEQVKRLILIKKRPNRKPFAREGALYSLCGQRCDLCVHYSGQDPARRAQIEPLLSRMWGTDDWSMRCDGCLSDGCYCADEPCHAKRCAAQRGLTACRDCPDHPCIDATAADRRSMIASESHSADEITWAILPYVPRQYEDR